jgi:hypothetical protein
MGKLLCVGREVSVGKVGTIDNLFLSTGGYPVIVETKLLRSPEARREVLAQTLEYVKEVVRYDFNWFVQQWKSFTQQPEGQADFLSRLNEISEDDIDEDFSDRVNLALSRGDVIAVIVGDGIESRLQELVAFLGRESAHLGYSLAVVELACYQFSKHDETGLLIVPRVVQELEPDQRAYVRIELGDGLEGKLIVKTIVVPPGPGGTHAPNLSEEEFLLAVEKSVGGEVRDKIKAFYDDLVESFSLEPDFKAATLMLKVPDPHEEHTGASVMAIEKQGRIYNTKMIQYQLKHWGFAPEIVDEITSDYWNALHKIDSRFSPKGIRAPKLFLPFKDVVAKLADIKSAIGNVVARIRAEADKVGMSQ